MRKILASIVTGGLLAGGVTTTATANDLVLGDDDFVLVPLAFTFNFYGVAYNDIYVGSNGFITFGAGDTDFSESLPEFLGNEPRIAGFWDDLSPNNAGNVHSDGDANSMSISFNEVPEFFDTGSNSFSMQLFADGRIKFTYSGMTASDAIVGLSPGGNLGNPGTAVDFSTSGTWTLPGLGDQAIYEVFTGNFDLDQRKIEFVPAPGALALLGLAGLVGTRRRRA